MNFPPDSVHELDQPTVRSKADWLAKLRTTGAQYVVDDFVTFTCREWKTSREEVLIRVTNTFPERPALIVRSSAVGEDGKESLAGAFLSEVMSADAGDEQLIAVVSRVIASYSRGHRIASDNDQVFVQKYVDAPVIAGVVLTYDIWGRRPYYVVNYDDKTGRTDTVTAGRDGRVLRLPRSVGLGNTIPQQWQRLLDAVAEIELRFPLPVLDIEFAITADDAVHIFQVRELKHLHQEVKQTGGGLPLARVQESFSHLRNRSKALAGNTTVLADMPDWNPAEILGSTPHPLDVSLYEYLVTDSCWNLARREMGYFDVDGHKLMFVLGWKPYIDVRVSLNSLTPASLSPRLREGAVNHGLDKLVADPGLQDKLEFEVAFSCADFGTRERLEACSGGDTSTSWQNEMWRELILFTNTLVNSTSDLIRTDIALVRRLAEVSAGNSGGVLTPLQLGEEWRIQLQRCREFGTIPFTRLARLAFVAMALIRSALSRNLISEDAHRDFSESLATVATSVANGCGEFACGTITHREFVECFGHLRPRMYNIVSLPYAAYPVEFWQQGGFLSKLESQPKLRDAALSSKAFDSELRRIGLEFDSKHLAKFARTVIEAREFAKFEFSRCVSVLMERTVLAGKSMGLTREDLSFLTASDMVNAPRTHSWDGLRDYFLKAIETRRVGWHEFTAVAMPNVLRDGSDLYCVQSWAGTPTFVTKKRVHGSLLPLEDISPVRGEDVTGSIVLLEAADPGFDWIFAFDPAGLVTRYGGAGSHMAVRCAEFGIPAAVGCGEATYYRLLSARAAVLDCAEEVLHGAGDRKEGP